MMLTTVIPPPPQELAIFYNKYIPAETIAALKLVKLGSFLLEIVVYLPVGMFYVENVSRVQFLNREEPFYCAENVWKLNTFVFLFLTAAIVSRVAVILEAACRKQQ
jgi:hypothetical protein